VLAVNGVLRVVDDLPGAFSDIVIQAFQRRQDDEFCMALSGGATARACYERLAETGAELIDWWAVNIFWSHERCVPADDPESNQLLVRQSLLERVGAANAVYPMRCDEGPGPYQLRLGEIGKLDLVHLTLAPDGHTASLFTGSAALDADPGQWVTLSDDPSGGVAHRGMTLTLSGISRARLVVFTVDGEATRDALQGVVDGADLPASRVAADEVIWLVDREIAPRQG
jgi:6-phosphogluconolactonase